MSKHEQFLGEVHLVHIMDFQRVLGKQNYEPSMTGNQAEQCLKKISLLCANSPKQLSKKKEF